MFFSNLFVVVFYVKNFNFSKTQNYVHLGVNVAIYTHRTIRTSYFISNFFNESSLFECVNTKAYINDVIARRFGI